jgi:hypothetical protein
MIKFIRNNAILDKVYTNKVHTEQRLYVTFFIRNIFVYFTKFVHYKVCMYQIPCSVLYSRPKWCTE